MNTGSHDAGADANWKKDPVTGRVTYVGGRVSITPAQAEAYRKEKELDGRRGVM